MTARRARLIAVDGVNSRALVASAQKIATHSGAARGISRWDASGLFEQLLVAGHTDPDAGRCEVTRALVAVRKLTGRVAPSSKFPDPEQPTVIQALDEAQRIFEEEKDRLEPVVVI